MEPHYDNNTVYQPVIFGDRTLGFLEFSFKDKRSLEEAKPLVIEFSNRLAARIPHYRLLNCIDAMMKELHRLSGDILRDRDVYDNLAGRMALLLGESACSIWIYDGAKKEFECIGRSGMKLSLRKIRRYEEALVVKSYESGKSEKINLEDPEHQVIARAELLQQGFLQGIGTSSKAEDMAVIIVIWSKSKYEESYFKEEDERILSLVAFILSQVIRLQRHLATQRRIRDETMVHLGHELRDPLGAIYSAIELLQRHPSLEKRYPYILSDVMSFIDYELFMVKNLLLFAQIEGLTDVPEGKIEREPYKLFEDIIFKIKDTLRIFAKGRGLDIKHDFPPATFPERLYLTKKEKSYLESIFFNLLSNAIKYSLPEKGRIIHIIGKSSRGRILIKVQNYGVGIVAGEESVIFEKCRRGSNADQGTPPGGSGLGLYIAGSLAEMLGGELRVSSRDDPTEFTLTLPLELFLKADNKGGKGE